MEIHVVFLFRKSWIIEYYLNALSNLRTGMLSGADVPIELNQLPEVNDAS